MCFGNLRMIYLILTIIVTTSLFIIFKYFERFQINTFQAIVSNYITCVIVGFLFKPDVLSYWDPAQGDWLYFAIFMGALFICIFYLIALTAQRVGVTAVSIASKISMIIPILFSLLILKSSVKEFDLFNYIGLAISLFAVLFASYKSPQLKEHSSRALLILPIVVFLFTGMADSIMNYTNVHYLTNDTAALFSVSTFAFSSFFGLLMISFRLVVLKNKISPKSIVAGIVLGIPNYFSIYFLLRSLSAFNNDGAFMFPIMNIGVIILSIIVSILLFGEKLSRINQIGILLSLLAITLISYQELFHG